MDKTPLVGKCYVYKTLKEVIMDYRNNMEFEIKSGFLPNMYNSDRLKVLEVSDSSVIIQMNNAMNRSVFPVDNFDYWIKRGLLVNINEKKRTS